MQCVKPVRLLTRKILDKYPDGLLVPCGKCIACRIAKKKEWTLRLLHEQHEWEYKTVFITLTYADEFEPDNHSLDKRELQKFFKRLRKSLGKEKIKYYACGEYGDETQRPHYHAIIFGLTPSDKDKQRLELAWPFGFVHVGTVSPDSINYVCKYINKQYSGELAEIEYNQKNREPVFCVMSNGLGRDYCINNSKQFIENQSITMYGETMPFPRYYIKKLNLENSDFRKEITKRLDAAMTQRLTGERLTSDEYYRAKSPKEVKRFEEHKRKQYDQKEKTLNARIALKSKKKI